MIANFRAKVLSIPNGCAGIVAQLADSEACREVLEDACRDACAELSEYDPAPVVGHAREEIASREPEEEEGE